MADDYLEATLYSVRPEWEQIFNDWYDTHVPHLLRIPGWEWGQRYVTVLGARKYMALYHVRGPAALEAVLAGDLNRRHPIAVLDWHNYLRMRAGIERHLAGTYRLAWGTETDMDALLQSARPLAVALVSVSPDREPEWVRWCDQTHLPGMARVPGCAAVARFQVSRPPFVAPEWPMDVHHILVYVAPSVDALLSFADPACRSPEARTAWKEAGAWEPHLRRYTFAALRPIARFSSFRAEADGRG